MYSDILNRIRTTFPWLNGMDTIEKNLLLPQSMNEYQSIAHRALYDRSFQTFCLGRHITVSNKPFIDLLLEVMQRSISQKYALYVRYVYQLMTS